MRRWSRAALIAAVALAAFTAFAAGSWARNLSTSEPRFDMKWTALQLRTGAEAGATCNVTLQGRFERSTFVKTNQAKVGEISVARVEDGTGGMPCANGSYTMAGTTWEMQYIGFLGTLPNITTVKVRFIRANIRFTTALLQRCEYTTTVTNPVNLRIAREGGTDVREITPETGGRIPSETAGCNQLTWEETRGEYTKQGATERVRFTLI